MLLPTSKFFVLYQHHKRGCQKVRGMSSREVVIKFDDEDSNNNNYCHGAVPYITLVVAVIITIFTCAITTNKTMQ